MYQKNDIVIYHHTGACRITDISTLSQTNNQDKKYYTLEPLFSATQTIHVFIHSQAFMRPLISIAEAKSCLQHIAELPATTYIAKDARQNAAQYTKILETHDFVQCLQLVKTLYLKTEQLRKDGKPIPQTEQKFLKQAEQFVYGELAVVLGQTPDDIRNMIYTALCAC